MDALRFAFIVDPVIYTGCMESNEDWRVLEVVSNHAHSVLEERYQDFMNEGAVYLIALYRPRIIFRRKCTAFV
jgi:hypothetical protein